MLCIADIAAMFSRALCYAALQVEVACQGILGGGRRMNSCSPAKGQHRTGHPSRKTATVTALHRRLDNISAPSLSPPLLLSDNSNPYRPQSRCFEIRPRKLHPEHQPKTPSPRKSEYWLQHCATREEDSPSNAYHTIDHPHTDQHGDLP